MAKKASIGFKGEAPKAPKTKARTTKVRTSAPQFYPLGQVPEGFFRPYFPLSAAAITSPEQALTLSPFYAGLRLYQTSTSLLPLLTYRRTDQGRERSRTHPAARLLSERPNPAMTRASLMEFVIREMFLQGNAFLEVIWSGNHAPVAIYPVPAKAVTKIELGDDWTKTYTVQTQTGTRTVGHEDMIHILGPCSHDGILGVPFVSTYAAEALGLHRQVLEAATAFFSNAARPNVYVSFPGQLNPNALNSTRDAFKARHAGTENTGSTAVLMNGGKLEAYPGVSGEDGRFVEALNSATVNIAQWFGVSPLTLGDLTRGTYSNAAADNQAFYQKCLAPVLNKIQQSVNYVLFGVDAEFYCEFEPKAILDGDPVQQSQIFATGIASGYYLRSEIREWLNLPPVPGIDDDPEPLAAPEQSEAPVELDDGGDSGTDDQSTNQ